MLTRRRVVSAVVVFLLAAVAWTAWLAFQTARDLRTAERAVDRIRAAIATDDIAARTEAIEDLAEASRKAKARTAGVWWSGLTWAPMIGDDIGGVKDLSESLDLLARRAFVPLGDTLDSLDSVVAGGRVDVDRLEALTPRVSAAHAAFEGAAQVVGERDSSGFAGPLKSRFREYVSEVSKAAADLSSAEDAIAVLPTLLGGDGPRQYLFVFENNAEIRATGGLPGSWALVKANDGQLTMAKQGNAADFDVYTEPIGGITVAEADLFGKEMGRFFQDPNFTPDFPRAAQVFDAFWTRQFPRLPIDGVVSVDTIALSYLLEATGPVQVQDLTLTSSNVVDSLLRDVYEEPVTAKQNEVFRNVARTIFDTITTDLEDPLELLTGIARATSEGRFRMAAFDQEVNERLSETRVAGELSGDLGKVPSVDIALNDATASKMSYYLRYRSEVQSLSCSGEVQRLAATVTLSQIISPSEARSLPPYVTGGGPAGANPGSQFVRVHVIAPFAGSIGDVKIDGASVGTPQVVTFNGRPAITLAVLIDSLQDVLITFEMETGPGQTQDGVLESTPSVLPGENVKYFSSSC